MSDEQKIKESEAKIKELEAKVKELEDTIYDILWKAEEALGYELEWEENKL
tara:strand:- start:82 stop:234 length:153 start_codon:yes stop_codon:yes gene_type:complete